MEKLKACVGTEKQSRSSGRRELGGDPQGDRLMAGSSKAMELNRADNSGLQETVKRRREVIRQRYREFGNGEKGRRSK